MTISAATALGQLQALTITGVTTHLDSPPSAILDTQLPAGFPTLPAGGSTAVTAFSCDELGRRLSVQYIVAVERVNQSLAVNQAIRPTVFETMFDLIDAMTTAFQTLDFANFVEWQIRATTDIEAIRYGFWCLIATITGRDS